MPKVREIDECFEIVRPSILGFNPCGELEVIAVTTDTRFYCALHYIAARVIRSGVKPGIQQCLSVAKVLLGQLLEIAAIHRGYFLLLLCGFLCFGYEIMTDFVLRVVEV